MQKYKDTRFSVDRDGNCYNQFGDIIGTPDVGGYVRVGQHLGRVNGVQKKQYYKVHRMVAETFLPNPNNLPQVNHKNGIKTDNRVENLEWCDTSHNMQHAYDTGLHSGIGETHYLSKFSDIEVKYIREQYTTGKYTQARIARVFNTTRHYINKLVLYKTRTKLYNI